jgi:hypothetical protein
MKFKEFFNKTIKEQYENDYTGTLDESGAGLSRVLSKLDDGSDFLFITAARGGNSKKVNASNNNDLLRFFREETKSNAGAYKIVGHWKECSQELKDDEKISDCKGSITNALEETWLIIRPDNISPEEFNNIAIKISRKYNQDAYVIRLNNKLTLNGKDGTVWSDLGKANKDSLSTGFNKIVNVQGYSELAKLRSKGRIANIVFEGLFSVVPKNTNSSKLLFDKVNILF